MPIVKVAPEQTALMAQCRQQEIERDFPQLMPENYASEEEYRQALLTSYEGLRSEEYKLIVQNECTKIYNLAMDARAADTPAQSSLPARENQNAGQTSRSSDSPERNNVRTIPLSQLLKTLNSRNN